MFIPHYDEFLIFTTREDIIDYINYLRKKGITSKKEIIYICNEHFGKELSDKVREIVYSIL